MIENKLNTRFPSAKEATILVVVLILFLTLTGLFVGLRGEHFLMAGLFLLLFFVSKQSRKLAVGLIPFVLFGLSYDWMRVYPNYMVNPIDVEGLYNLEKSLFGIFSDGRIMIPCEYFSIHHSPIVDFISGIFYFSWVPFPVGFAIYLYLTNKRYDFIQFSTAFLFVNLIGFTIYYIHPAAPPWYALQYGFEPILDTPGNMAGLARFDDLIGFSLFGSIYGRNANVFAAVPSLHSAYLVVVLYYAIKTKSKTWLIVLTTIFLIGIWLTAVYTSHHYIIDVMLGILCAIFGLLLFDKVLMRLSFMKKFFQSYYNYIS